METMAYYLAQEKELVLKHFFHRDAFALGKHLSEIAIEKNYAVAVEIEINHETVYKYINDGATENNCSWIGKKGNVVKHFQMSSGALAAKLAERKQKFADAYGDDSEYAATPGAFPIRVHNVGVIGVAGISGLDSDRDHQLLVDGLKYMLEQEDTE